MSTYETTAGLGDERVRILPRRGLVKNHYYTRATHGSWRLCGAIVVISWREVFFLGPQRAMLEWGEEEMRSAASLRPGMRLLLAKPSLTIALQNYCFFLTWQWVGPDCVRYWSGSCASACCFLTNTAFLKKTRSNRSN